MDVGALQAHVVEDRRESWIRGEIDHVVRHLRVVCEFVAEAHAVVLQRGSRQHMNAAGKVSLILQRSLRPSPQRSFAGLPRLKHVELMSFGASTRPYCDVLRKEDLD